MKWDKEDKAALLGFKESVDVDEVKVKEQIKKVLLNNRFIVHVLNNGELESADAEPDDYFNVNIRPYYMIPETQSNVKNYLCYEVGYDEVNRYNSLVKTLQITFYIMCHVDDILDKDTGIPRHDLLAALVQDQFNYTTYIGGGRIQLVYDKPSTTDNKYATRTLIFEQITDNNIVKTKNGSPRIINKDMQSLAEISEN